MADRIRRAPDVLGATAEEVMGSLREDVALAFKRCNQLERELADAAKLLAERDAEIERIKAAMQDAPTVHANILRGTIALTKAQAIHIAGLDANIEQQLASQTALVEMLRAALVKMVSEVNRGDYPTRMAAFEQARAALVAAGKGE